MSTNSLVKSVQSAPGFKLSNTHFRIGSKVHLSDFYYAKRFFQNGFFASRFAFLLATDIFSALQEDRESESPSSCRLTLIGYGLYSELLISLAAKFLRRKLQLADVAINHDVVLDTEELCLTKGIKPYGLAVIIVPIATTFSTSLKIEEKLCGLEDFRGTLFLKPHFNVLYVSDSGDADDLSDVENLLGWKSKSHQRKEVVIRSSHFNDDRIQRYYLSVPTKWHAASKCALCYPDGTTQERALFETDKTSVTPTLIFDFPRGRFIRPKDANREFVLDDETVKYGHHVRNNAHFLYSIDSEQFLTRNTSSVVNWLRELRQTFVDEVGYTESSYVVIVSPCHYSNAAFIDLVNELLFSSAANIIHYDPTSDYVDNFEKVYSDELSRADHVIFVDDSLKSGSAFRRMNFFIRQALKGRNGHGVSACVTLLNKSDRYTQNWISDLLTNNDAIYSFAHLHIYGPVPHGDRPILEQELRQYRRLEVLACLESLTDYFAAKVKKMVPREEHLLPRPSQSQIQLVNVTHDVYEFFTHSSIKFGKVKDFDDFRKALSSPRQSVSSRCNYQDSASTHDPLLKVLCHPPFTNYRLVRERAFDWVASLLRQQMDAIQHDEEDLLYPAFRTLKFLMRRSCLLNSSFLISRDWLEFLSQSLFRSNALPALVKKLGEEERKLEAAVNKDLLAKHLLEEIRNQRRNVLDFNVYYVALAKELLVKNRVRSIALQESLKGLSNSNNWQLNQIRRMLNEENTVLVQSFVDFVSASGAFRDLYGRGPGIDPDLNKIEKFVRLNQVSGNVRFSSLVELFAQCNEPHPFEHIGLRNFLWLIQYLSNDRYLKRAFLEERTKTIMSKLTALLSDGIQRNTGCYASSGPHGVGSFLIVMDLRKTPLVTYWANEYGSYSHSKVFSTPPKSNDDTSSFIDSFMRGKGDRSGSYKKTIVELHRPDPHQNVWVDIYGDEKDRTVSLEEEMLSTTCNRLLLIRLGTRGRRSDAYTGRGLLAFFYNVEGNVPLNSMTVRLLLLLRSPLSDFIQKHHENNEFVEWRMARQTKKLSLLTSHGQAIINSLAFFGEKSMRDRFTTIALTQTLIQQRVLLGTSGGPFAKVHDAEDQFEQAVSALNEPEIIDRLFFDSLKKLAEEVFRSEYVEESVSSDRAKVHLHCDEQLSVKSGIGTTLLDFVMFELFMNAKKNRWDFMPDEEEVDFSDELTARNSNIVRIKVEQNSTLKICVSNTGPLVDQETRIAFRKGQPPPKNQEDPISGSKLVKDILDSLGGSIGYEVEEERTDTNASLFSVTVDVPIFVDDE